MFTIALRHFHMASELCHCRHITSKGTSVSDKLASTETQGPALLEGAGVINLYSVRLLFIRMPQ